MINALALVTATLSLNPTTDKFQQWFVRPGGKTVSKARKEKILEAAGRVLSGVAGKEAEDRLIGSDGAADTDSDAEMLAFDVESEDEQTSEGGDESD